VPARPISAPRRWAAAVERAGLSGDAIERIYMGCVLPAGLGQAPARQAALNAGLPNHIEATTVNKMCGSGMQAAIMAADALAAGSVDLLVAGGMESMTNAPYLSLRHRGGARIGHDRLMDHMYLDGLEDAYEPGRLMGSFAEETAGRNISSPARRRTIRDRLAPARPEGAALGCVRSRDRPRRGEGPQGRHHGHVRRAAGQRAISPRSRRSSPLSRRTARSPPPMLRRSRTARRRW
jgi:hypothetical protein